MKRFITFFACFVLALQVSAQDVDLLNRIQSTNEQVKSFEADLVNTEIKSKKTVSNNGKLFFLAPKKFAALFTTDNYMIVNPSHIKLDIGRFSGTYRLRDGGILRSLSNVFLYGFRGCVQQLADENGYSLTTETKDGYHVITGTIKKKKLVGVGFKQVIFKYNVDTLLLKEIILRDYRGNCDVYTISNVQYDVAVDHKNFDI